VAAAMGGPLTLSPRRHEQALAVGAAGVLICAASVAPLLHVFLSEAAALPDLLAAVSNARIAVLLGRSIALAAAVTLLALGGGLVVAVLVARTDAFAAWPAALAHAFPATLPPFLLALGWFHVFGAGGILGSAGGSRLFFSGAGMVLVLALALMPIASALAALGLRGVDPGLEEAARLVAGPWRALALVSIPSAAPALALAALVIFTLAFSELGVAMFLRVDVFPAAVFARLGGVAYAPGEALALVLPVLPLALGLLIAERRLVSGRSFAVFGPRSGRAERILLGRWRGLASAGLWLLAVLSVAPLVSLAWTALRGRGFSGVDGWLGGAAWTSLAAAGGAATIIVVLALVAGHAAARRTRGGAVLDAAAVLAFVVPAAVLGLGLIGVWNRPGLRSVYGGIALLIVGYVARYLVIGIRVIGALVAQTPIHLEEAAAVTGAGYARRLARILVPLHREGIALAWLLAFVFCLRDLELPVLYYPPGGEPLTVRLFTLEANGPEPVVAALALVQVAITAVAVAGGGWWLRRASA
jgi:iron(III) transport system permease protein